MELIADIETNDLLYRIRGTQDALMSNMNTFDRTPTTPGEYRPIVRVSGAERDSQQSECCCPELCQIDHDN